MDTEAKDPNFAYTFARGLAVLRAFDASSPALNCTEIAATTGLARPAVVRLVNTLVKLGYLKSTQSATRYRLDASVLTLAYPLLSQLSARQMARQEMQQLADFAKGAVSLTMRSGVEMVIVESCARRSAHTGKPDIGARRPLAASAYGHAYFCSMPMPEKTRIRQTLAQTYGAEWPALETKLSQAEQRYASKRYCTFLAKELGIWSVAAPLRSNLDGEVLVMNCAVASFNLARRALEEQIAPRLLNLVRQVEVAQGTRAFETPGRLPDHGLPRALLARASVELV